MGTKKDDEGISYLARRTLNALQELYDKYSRPIGLKALSTFLSYRHEDKLEEALQELVDDDLAIQTSLGVWLPYDATETDRETIHKKLSVRKEFIRGQVDLLEHALRSKSPREFKRFAKDWCDDMELHLS